MVSIPNKITDEERIAFPRERCLERKDNNWEYSNASNRILLATYRSLKASERKPWPVRCGLRTRDR